MTSIIFMDYYYYVKIMNICMSKGKQLKFEIKLLLISPSNFFPRNLFSRLIAFSSIEDLSQNLAT